MNSYKKSILLGALSLLVVSCISNPEARKPISQASGSFMKSSILKNKKLVANESQQIQEFIKKQPQSKYLTATKGFWYTYVTQNPQDTLRPKKGDVAFFDYEIKDLKGNLIYSKAEMKPQTYAIDKQNLIIGLREGLKLMHKKETITFLFPSNVAYGYHGDEKKIGTNIPLQCTVTLHNFLSEVAFDKEIVLKNKTKKPSISKPIDTTNH